MTVHESRSEQHTMIVNTVAEDGIDVEHPATCPTEHDEDFGTVYLCDVHEQLNSLGMDCFFVHKDDTEFDMPWAQPLVPGSYQFVAWFKVTDDLDGREYDAGLELVSDG